MKSGAPGRAPGRAALPSSQTGRRAAVRPAWSPGDGPACGRPARVGGPCRRGAWVADGCEADGAGARRWGRPVARDAPEPARRPVRNRPRDRALPRPASRTRVPFPWHRAPARGASVCLVDGLSAWGTCVRNGKGGVGRNGCRITRAHRPIRLCAAETPALPCNASCTWHGAVHAVGRPRPAPRYARRRNPSADRHAGGPHGAHARAARGLGFGLQRRPARGAWPATRMATSSSPTSRARTRAS